MENEMSQGQGKKKERVPQGGVSRSCSVLNICELLGVEVAPSAPVGAAGTEQESQVCGQLHSDPPPHDDQGRDPEIMVRRALHTGGVSQGEGQCGQPPEAVEKENE